MLHTQTEQFLGGELGQRRIWGSDGGPGPWSGRGPGGIGRQGCRGGTGRAGGQGGDSKAGCHQGGADNIERSVFLGCRILWAPVPKRFLEWICGVQDQSGLCGLPDRSRLCGLPDRSGSVGSRSGLWSGLRRLTERSRLHGLMEWSGLCGLLDRSELWSGLRRLTERSRLHGLMEWSGLWSRLRGLTERSGLWSGLCRLTDWSGLWNGHRRLGRSQSWNASCPYRPHGWILQLAYQPRNPRVRCSFVGHHWGHCGFIGRHWGCCSFVAHHLMAHQHHWTPRQTSSHHCLADGRCSGPRTGGFVRIGGWDSGGWWTTQTLPLLSPHIGWSVLSGIDWRDEGEDSNAGRWIFLIIK